MTDWMDDDLIESGTDSGQGIGALEAGMAYAGMGLLLDRHAARIEAAIQSIAAGTEVQRTDVVPPLVTPELFLDVVPEWDVLTDAETNLSVLSLRTHIELASRTGQPMDHVLIVGPAGVGKTTLARRVAADLGRLSWLLAPPYSHRQLPALGLTVNALALSEVTQQGDGSPPPNGVLILDQLDRASKSDPLMADALTWLLDTGHAWSTDIADGLSPVGSLTIVATVRDTSRLPDELLDRFPIRVQLQHSSPGSPITSHAWLLELASAGVLDLVSSGEYLWLDKLAGSTARSARRLGRNVATWVDAYGQLPTPEQAALLVQRDPRFSRPSTYLPYLRLLAEAGRGLSVGEIAARIHMPVDDLHRLEGDIIDTDGYAFVDEHELRWITPEGRDHVVLSGLTIGQMLDRLDQP